MFGRSEQQHTFIVSWISRIHSRSPAEGTGDGAVVADINALLASEDLQKILDQVFPMAEDGADSTLSEIDPGFERFCTEILGETNDDVTTTDCTESESTKDCRPSPMDCTASDIIIAPTWRSQTTSSGTSVHSSVDTPLSPMKPFSAPGSIPENPPCEDTSTSSLPSVDSIKCHERSSEFDSSPFLFCNDIKEDIEEQSPLIGNDDPMLYVQPEWNISDETYPLFGSL